MSDLVVHVDQDFVLSYDIERNKKLKHLNNNKFGNDEDNNSDIWSNISSIMLLSTVSTIVQNHLIIYQVQH